MLERAILRNEKPTDQCMNEYDFVLPTSGLPPTNFPPNTELDYFYLHEHEKHLKHHEKDDFKYCFNSYGYRCPEFDKHADIRIVAIGCSYVMGIGLPESALFHYRFARQLESYRNQSAVVWNLGSPSASNDYISRLLYLAIPYLDPHIVLVNFTHGGRREYLSVQKKIVPYNPWLHGANKTIAEICNHFSALNSHHDDVLNFFKNYKAVESSLQDRCWLFSTIDPQVLEEVKNHIDIKRYAGNLPIIDKALDQLHPGPKSQEILFKNYWDRFIELQHEF